MSLADAFAESDSKYRAQVMHATWGHLEQRRGEIQTGYFVFTISATAEAMKSLLQIGEICPIVQGFTRQWRTT